MKSHFKSTFALIAQTEISCLFFLFCEKSRKMSKHSMEEGHGVRSSLSQSILNECPPTTKCRGCQSAAGWDWSWQRPCHKVAPVYVGLSPGCFKQGQIVNTVTESTVQKAIAQIVSAATWQTKFWRWAQRNHISKIGSFNMSERNMLLLFRETSRYNVRCEGPWSK